LSACFSRWRNRPVGASSSVIIVVRFFFRLLSSSFFFRLLSSSSLRFLSRFLQPYSFPQNGGMFNWSYFYLSRLCGYSIQIGSFLLFGPFLSRSIDDGADSSSLLHVVVVVVVAG
jgi:hypothetical protein